MSSRTSIPDLRGQPALSLPKGERGRGRGRPRLRAARPLTLFAVLAFLLPVAAPALVAAGEPAPAPAAAAVAASGDDAPLVDQYREGGGMGRQSSKTHAVLFWIGAAAALVGALFVVVSRRPMRSALGLLVTILATAGFYLLLRAELLAALQVLIYAGAVVVLLVFVITFLEQGAVTAPGGRRLPVRILSVAAMVYVFYVVARELFALGLGTRLPPPAGFGTTAGLGDALFTTFVVPFEAVSALLLTAIIGAVAVARGRDGGSLTPTPTLRQAQGRLLTDKEGGE